MPNRYPTSDKIAIFMNFNPTIYGLLWFIKKGKASRDSENQLFESRVLYINK